MLDGVPVKRLDRSDLTTTEFDEMEKKLNQLDKTWQENQNRGNQDNNAVSRSQNPNLAKNLERHRCKFNGISVSFNNRRKKINQAQMYQEVSAAQNGCCCATSK